MLAIRFAVQNASTPDQLVENLQTFVEHLHRYRIEEILPEGMAGISANDVEDVHAWAHRLSGSVHDGYCLTAAGQLWFEEIRDAYFAASRRLRELDEARAAVHASPPPAVAIRPPSL